MIAGTKLRLREPDGTPWSFLTVIGSYEMAEGAPELVVAPTYDFATPTTVSPDGLGAYELDDSVPEDEGVKALRERLSAVGIAWGTDPAEVVA